MYPVLFAGYLWILSAAILAYTRAVNKRFRERLILLTVSLSALLLMVSSKHLVYVFDLHPAWLLLSLAIAPVAITTIAFQIIEFNNRNAKIIASEAVLFSIGMLLLSMLFVTSLQDVVIITSLTFVLLIVLGMLFVHSMQHEIHQQTEIEKLLGGLSRANQKLSSMDKQKSEFVSIASHQLRSPLTAIRGYASMLLEGSFGTFPQKARKPLEHIEMSAGMMALSIEDYLNVSRIESGNMNYDYSDFNLHEFTVNICDDLRGEATRSGLLLLCRSDLTGDPIVHADRGKTQQILHNLIHNALKYTHRGTITVFIHETAEMILVDVVDSGIGMSEETQQNIFQKFQRAQPAQSINVHGTGLGLYVAKRMAVAMGGDITGYSDGEGMGSRFTFSLPRSI